MTASSPGRKARRLDKKLIAPQKRHMTPEETMELQEMQRLVNFKAFEANTIKHNTALVPRGQAMAEEAMAVAKLLDNAKREWVARKLLECGYASNTLCDINLTTGEIYPRANLTPNEPKNGASAH